MSKKTLKKQTDKKRHSRSLEATYCFHCGTMLHKRLAHQKACNIHLPLLKGEVPEMGAKALRSQSKQPESVSGEELDPSDWAQQAAKKLIKQEARRCRDCGGTLPPQRYFRCEYCIAPELLEDDMGSEWDHVEGL